MPYPKLPEQCPTCGAHFSRLTRPKPMMQKKAWTIFLIGVAVSLPWAAGVFVSQALSDSYIIPLNAGGILGLTMLAFLPAFLGGMIAFKFPRLLHLRCRQCQWTRTYEMVRYRA